VVLQLLKYGPGALINKITITAFPVCIAINVKKDPPVPVSTQVAAHLFKYHAHITTLKLDVHNCLSIKNYSNYVSEEYRIFLIKGETGRYEELERKKLRCCSH
jgi:hypothetical protein